MASDPDINYPRDYRGARKAFIAACQEARADSIARVHPATSGPRGNPLFLDCVALGPREARKALLLITGGDGRTGWMDSHVLVELLHAKVQPPPESRLVMVHAFNPFGMARGTRKNEEGVDLDQPEAAASWSFAMLRAILTEDLAHVEKLRVLDLAHGPRSRMMDMMDGTLARTLAAFKPGTDLRVARLILAPAQALAGSRAVVTRALAGL